MILKKRIKNLFICALGIIILPLSSTNYVRAESSSGDAMNIIYVDSMEDVNMNEIGEDEIVAIKIEDFEENDTVDEGVSISEPILKNPLLRDTSIPIKSWNISSKGQYNYSGSTFSKVLYTNYNFKGKTHYIVACRNRGDKNLKLSCKTLSSSLKSITVKPGYYYLFHVYTQKTTTSWYIRFEVPADFSGYVS